jgi:hypothetical protein
MVAPHLTYEEIVSHMYAVIDSVASVDFPPDKVRDARSMLVPA